MVSYNFASTNLGEPTVLIKLFLGIHYMGATRSCSYL